MQRVLTQLNGSKASAQRPMGDGRVSVRRPGERLCALMAGCALGLSAESALAVDRRADVSASASVGGVAAATPGREGANAAVLPTWARAYAQGQWSAAVELLETIPEASRTAWHWLHLSRALEKRTQLVEAFGAYERLLDVTAESAALPGMKDVERAARAESSKLSSRIPWAEVALGEGLPVGALVYVDQQWLEPARLRSPYPVNPGWHIFLVESNGEVLAARRAFFDEGQSRVIPLAPLGDPAGSAESAGPGVAASGVSTFGASAKQQGRPRRRPLTWQPQSQALDVDRQENLMRASYISLGVGVLGATVGTGLAISGANSDDRASIGYATLSYGVSLVALITGGVLWALHHDPDPAAVNVANVKLEPMIYPGGAAVHGSF